MPRRHLPRTGLSLGLLACAVVLIPAASAPAVTFTDFSSTINNSDPTQTGRLIRDEPPSACGAPTIPGALDTEPYHYDFITLRNRTLSPMCITVTIDSTNCATDSIQSAAYAPFFQPGDSTANYLGDIGLSPSPIGSYSFSINSRQHFEITVNETHSGLGCFSYDASIASDKPWAYKRPKIVGEPGVGTELRANAGRWAGVVDFERQWRRCGSPGGCEDIPGATGNRYTPTIDDGGFKLQLVVQATQGGETSIAKSSKTDPVVV